MSKKQMGSAQRLVIEAIKDWMKRHRGEPVPGFREVTANIQGIPASYFTSYTNQKKQAFKELEREGFVLKYTNDLQTVAMVDGYRTPLDAAEKVATKILGLPEKEEQEAKEEKEVDLEQSMKWYKDKPAFNVPQPPPDPKPDKPKPPFLLIVNQTGLKATELDKFGKIMQVIAELPKDIVVDIQIRARTKAKG